MEPTSLVLSIVSMTNMAILGILIAIFGNMYGKTRAQLPLGLIVVAGMLFLHNVIGAMAYFKLEEYEKCLEDANESIRIKPED